ncbi:YgiT-type zinc finger protein [Candidatus Bipolaricaulota bacterium]|nr:YgiT-type zinc finger protein [Candidatus Bipolaricaulota bacterium]
MDRCAVCGGELEKKRVTYTKKEEGGRLVAIGGVPLRSVAPAERSTLPLRSLMSFTGSLRPGHRRRPLRSLMPG